VTAQFVRLGETARSPVTIEVDGVAVETLAGDTLMVALLTHGKRLRMSEFGDGPRAGFCLMGACQDCMVWTPEGRKLRACDTPVSPGLKIVTSLPETAWPALVS